MQGTELQKLKNIVEGNRGSTGDISLLNPDLILLLNHGFQTDLQPDKSTTYQVSVEKLTEFLDNWRPEERKPIAEKRKPTKKSVEKSS